ncbi:glycosyltransferase family 2 protein [Pedobacter alluvionis]|uniref:Glycosyltransferase family 2 protein n=1 Tax=Pedobacter alluvionis TaxID=475253 RepID=A0A497YB35_9SPHI|nr:glycosyltransferase family 2 protein [Pedobacter alluvionis]RLJ79697.1 glycosyltransferase involved in cell wall biosynthesis [Pedobacter alluvionis]TFB31021.1 glycosyltransferase family 2 protein [Pedobacter alluvionis]
MKSLALCIPAYNAAWCLPRLLTSAQNQYIKFDEILVYNDYSSDNTHEVALKYGAVVIDGDVNRGCSFGKNRLAEMVKSEWIHFHDADDELLPNFTSLAHKWMAKEECPEVVLFNYEYRDHITNEFISLRQFDKHKLETDPIKYAIAEQINPFCGLYNKTAFLNAGGYDLDPKVLYNEDSALHISLALHHLRFSSEDEISIINYRIHNSMSQSNKEKCFLAQFYVMEKTALNAPSIYNHEIAVRFGEIATNLASINNWEKTKASLLFAKKLSLNSISANNNILFNVVSKFSPFAAFWIREKMIRLLKPRLRR